MSVTPIIFSIVAALAVLGFWLYRRNRKHVLLKAQILGKLREEGGWIVIADDESEPIFQGKLFTVTDDSFGLAIGVLMEENRNSELLKDLKAERSVEHLGPGQILAKAIIDFDTYIVMSELTDADLRQSIQDVIHSGRQIDVKLMLNSREIQFVNGVEDDEKYAEIWNKRPTVPGLTVLA